MRGQPLFNLPDRMRPAGSDIEKNHPEFSTFVYMLSVCYYCRRNE